MRHQSSPWRQSHNGRNSHVLIRQYKSLVCQVMVKASYATFSCLHDATFTHFPNRLQLFPLMEVSVLTKLEG